MSYYIPESQKSTLTYDEFMSAIYSHLDADDDFITDAVESVNVLKQD